jgi:hypothetical protein
MRTSIDLPDHLMKKAKLEAIERGVSMKDLIIQALEKEISGVSEPKQSMWKSLKGKGSAVGIEAATSGFEDYSGPDWIHAIQVNDQPE